MEHPHIVRVLEFGLDETPYLVMSYAPNGTLRQRHPKGVSLPLPTILSYTKQAADAFHADGGQMLWTASIGGPTQSSPTITNWVVYIGSTDHKLYAFHLPGTTP